MQPKTPIINITNNINITNTCANSSNIGNVNLGLGYAPITGNVNLGLCYAPITDNVNLTTTITNNIIETNSSNFTELIDIITNTNTPMAITHVQYGVDWEMISAIGAIAVPFVLAIWAWYSEKKRDARTEKRIKLKEIRDVFRTHYDPLAKPEKPYSEEDMTKPFLTRVVSVYAQVNNVYKTSMFKSTSEDIDLLNDIVLEIQKEVAHPDVFSNNSTLIDICIPLLELLSVYEYAPLSKESEIIKERKKVIYWLLDTATLLQKDPILKHRWLQGGIIDKAVTSVLNKGKHQLFDKNWKKEFDEYIKASIKEEYPNE